MQSLWMLLASAMFALMGACVKVATDWGADLALIMIFRGLPSILVILVWTMATRRSLRPRSWRFHIWRNIAGTGSMWLGFYAIAQLPLALAMSLNYTAPLFIAGWMLGWGGAQRDGIRVFTVVLGFLGVLAILRPGMGQEHWLAALAGIGAGGLAAISMMQLRELGRVGEPEWRTVFIFSSCIVISGIVMLLIQGMAAPDLRLMLALVGLGIFGLVGQLAVTRAFGMGSALLTAALQYTAIIFAALLGFLVWGSVPDLLAWAGMALIVASGLLSTWRTFSEDRLLQGSAPVATAPAGTDIQIAAAPPVAGVDALNPELSKEAQHA
ncbi:MAG: DMT family transporter [Castellaniella sp.]